MILAFDCAVAAGSISLVERSGHELRSFIGDSDRPLRAGELLPTIDRLLAGGGSTADDVEMIVTSAGPGSFTGIRIGIATAAGLARSLSAEMAVVPVLDAIIGEYPGSDIAAVPMGRGYAAYCSGHREDGVWNVPIEDIPHGSRVLHRELYSSVGSRDDVNIGENMALFLARFVITHGPRVDRPIFISKLRKE